MVVVVVGWWQMMDGGDITSPLHEFVLLPGTGLLTLRGGSRSAWGGRSSIVCLFVPSDSNSEASFQLNEELPKKDIMMAAKEPNLIPMRSVCTVFIP